MEPSGCPKLKSCPLPPAVYASFSSLCFPTRNAKRYIAKHISYQAKHHMMRIQACLRKKAHHKQTLEHSEAEYDPLLLFTLAIVVPDVGNVSPPAGSGLHRALLAGVPPGTPDGRATQRLGAHDPCQLPPALVGRNLRETWSCSVVCNSEKNVLETSV